MLPLDKHLDQVIFCVDDDGQGIHADDVARLFELFERGDSQVSGTGVGLYIVDDWIKLLGGVVEYEPSQHGGACFKITLPLKKIEPNAIANTAAGGQAIDLKQRFTGTKVLIVDDDPILLKAMRRMMSKLLDCEVDVAADGLEALDLLSTTGYSLILTDYFMPNMNGAELIREIRQRGYQAPIIALTAASIGDEKNELVEAGANQVLIKPPSKESMTTAVAAIMQIEPCVP